VYLRRLAESIASVPELSSQEFGGYFIGLREETALITLIRSEGYEECLPGEGARRERMLTLQLQLRYGEEEMRWESRWAKKKNEEASANVRRVSWYKRGMEEPMISTTNLWAGSKNFTFKQIFPLCSSTRWRGEMGGYLAG